MFPVSEREVGGPVEGASDASPRPPRQAARLPLPAHRAMHPQRYPPKRYINFKKQF